MIERFPKLQQNASVRRRPSRKAPLWLIGTASGLRALSLRHDFLLDVEIVELEDFYFSDATAWARRGSAFLRRTQHDALPSFVERWPTFGGRYGRAAIVDGKFTTVLYAGPSLVVATRSEPCSRGWDYFEAHRAKGAGLPPSLAARVAQRVADLLSIAHRRRVKHGAVVLDQIRIRADGSPILVGWSSARARGSGGEHGDDLWSIRKALGFDPAATSPADDVFRLGCVLATLLTGAPPFVEHGRGLRYEPPSERAIVPPALDAIVGRVCDPAQGLASSASELAASLAEFLADTEPSMAIAVRALEAGDLRAFAEWFARHNSEIGELHPALTEAARRFIVAPIADGDPPPIFAELLAAISEPARSVIVAAARDRSLVPYCREAAISLLERVGYPDAAALSYELADQEGAATARQGPGPRPVIVRSPPGSSASDNHGLCPHAWTSLTGEPVLVPAQPAQGSAPYRPDQLERVCPHCGPVAVRDTSWYVGEQLPPGPPLEVVIEGASGSEGSAPDGATLLLEPGWPYEFSAAPGARFFVEGLDPADASLWFADGRGNLFVMWGTLATIGFGDTRTAFLITGPRGRPGRAVKVGPVTLRAVGPGRVAVTCDPGARVEIRPK